MTVTDGATRVLWLLVLAAVIVGIVLGVAVFRALGAG